MTLAGTGSANQTSPPGAAHRLQEPFFEIGPKNLLRLRDLLEVSIAAERAGRQAGVSIIITPPTAHIAQVRRAAPEVLVFAQGMDNDDIGPSVGRVTAEALADAGAHGVMLNHSSNPLRHDQLTCSIERARTNQLLTMVCAASEKDVLQLLPHQPDVILFEPPELIGHRGGSERSWIPRINTLVDVAAPNVLMMHAGGVGTPDDAYQIMRAGAAGTGSTSGVLGSESPTRSVLAFIDAARRGFDDNRTSHDRHIAETNPA